MRRVLAIAFILLLVGTGGWLVAKTGQSITLAPGDSLPDLRVTTTTRNLQVQVGPRGALIILFHSRCDHCHAQLDRMAENTASLQGPIYLLTPEDMLPVADIAGRWNKLTARPDVRWATVEPDVFLRDFGTLVTPAIFVFGPDGSLLRKFRGETKLSAITSNR